MTEDSERLARDLWDADVDACLTDIEEAGHTVEHDEDGQPVECVDACPACAAGRLRGLLAGREEPTPPAPTIRDAVEAWYTDGFEGQAVLTGWYLIAHGTGFAGDGGKLAHIAQDWGDTDIVAQIGLTEYARQRVLDRMREETR
jgi:hypothetical protein